MLTIRQRQVLAAIKLLSMNGVGPSQQEVADFLEIAKSGAHRLINQLELRGFVRRMKGRSRAIEIVTAAPIAKPDFYIIDLRNHGQYNDDGLRLYIEARAGRKH